MFTTNITRIKENKINIRPVNIYIYIFFFKLNTDLTLIKLYILQLNSKFTHQFQGCINNSYISKNN